ncbi:MAG: Gfo/Idh/MocA family oxidoreductase [Amaricoccus sp.]|uniref:Gfo/Idh/MocA family protein n=1 Tax=Amaricoccus sp. TaxID=1872485 RepID=UPI0039E584A6
MDRLGVGIVGCGNISAAYFRLAPLFRGIEVRACADLSAAAAEARAAEFGVRAESVDALLADPDVDVVINLTIPAAHFGVTKAALEAGKHVYSEKPFVLGLEEGLELRRLADARGLQVGSAPDTFLGGAHQLARKLIDDGTIGTITAGTAFVLSHGMEMWHPNPGFFFLPGGGPMLDLGPYYVADLINLIGPVRRVAAMTGAATPTRLVTAAGPVQGQEIPVETPTTVQALLEFAGGAQVMVGTSWDVWGHRHRQPIELYGTEGSLFVPDPNWFGGTVEVAGRDGTVREETWEHPLGVPNDVRPNAAFANYRTAGLADMALAIIEGRDARCGLDRALHGIEVMTAILQSGETGRFVDLTTTCTRPEPLGPEAARALLA